jgi:hydrogenase 3 maturation protease
VQTLTTILAKKLENAERIGILGIGSELRADDVAGILVAKQVGKLITNKKNRPKLKVFIGATAPENLTSQIKKFQPTHLIIIDSADLNIKAGKIKVMNPDDIGGVSFCTHNLPIKVMTDYLLQSFSSQITIIGIQPENLSVGALPSKAVLGAVELLSKTITSLLLQRK